MIATTSASASASAAPTAFSATAPTISLGDRGMQRLVVKHNERRCGQCRASHKRNDDLTIGT
jgi:hypothetical protein